MGSCAFLATSPGEEGGDVAIPCPWEEEWGEEVRILTSKRRKQLPEQGCGSSTG